MATLQRILIVLLAAGLFLVAARSARADLVGYWKFDGDSLGDSAGFALGDHDGTHYTTSTATPTAATFSSDVSPTLGSGKSLDLTGANHFVEIDTFSGTASENDFDLGASITVSAWIKGWPSGSYWQPFVAKDGEADGWQLRRHSSGNTLDWTTRGTPASDFEGISTEVADNPGTWHHITATYDGARKKIYVNGVLDNSVSAAGSINTNDDNVRFGFGGAAGRFSRVMLDDIVIFDERLTFNQVAHLAAGGDPAALPQAAGLTWDFDDGTAQGWADVMGTSVANIGGRGAANSSGAWAHDGAHASLLFRSPDFVLVEGEDLSLLLSGGDGSEAGSLPLPTNESDILGVPNSLYNGGVMGVGLRRISDGEYVLTARRTGDNNDFGGGLIVWDEATSAPFLGGFYTLDLFDTNHGGWGHINIGSVSVPGFLIPEPSTFLLSALGLLGLALGGRRRKRT